MKNKLVLGLIISTLIISGCNTSTTNSNININKTQEVTQEIKTFDYKEGLTNEEYLEKELRSANKAAAILDVFEEQGKTNVELYLDIIDDFMKDKEVLKVTKTQLLFYFVPYFIIKSEDYNKKLNQYYLMLDNQDYYTKDTYLDKDKFLAQNSEEELNKLINKIYKNHCVVIYDVIPKVIVDWDYYINNYKDVIDPNLLNILETYKYMDFHNIRDDDFNLLNDVVVENILQLEDTVNKINESKPYLSYYDSLISSLNNSLYYYYDLFFGNKEYDLFDDNNELKKEYLDNFNKVIELYPNSTLSKIINNYLIKLQENDKDKTKFIKNNFATLYLLETISNDVENYVYGADGTLLSE